MIAAGLVLFAASAAIYVHGWQHHKDAEMEAQIDEALALANTPDFDANIAARWSRD